MNDMKTSLNNTLRTVIKCIVSLILLVAIVLFLRGGIRNGEQYLKSSANAATVHATVVRIEEDWDSEDGTKYKAMMRYTYAGKEYEHHYKTYSTYDKAAAMLDKTVTLTVDPEHPNETIEDIRSSCVDCCVTAMILLSSMVFLLGTFVKCSNVDTYGWHMETVAQDLPKAVFSKNMFIVPLIPALGGAALLSRYYDAAGGLVFLAEGAALIGSAVMLKNYLRKMKLVREGRYILRRDYFVSKRFQYDSDGPDRYYVTFTNGQNTWEENMGKRLYDILEPGDTIDTVYLEGEKKPIMRHIPY